METITLKFKASGQKLTADSCPQNYASNTVNYIQAEFDLDANWKSFDSVRAVWHNDFACISTVLDGNGKCTVPHEVLENLAETRVNLVGSIVDGTELTDRLTTYPIRAAIIDAEALICGTETAEVTPSQFEQYIAIVEQIVGTVKDIDHTELTDDYCLIIYYTDGTDSGKLGPIRGATGATGNGIVSTVLNADYTLTLTYDNGDSDTVGPIRGAQGETGNGIESVYLTETHGAVKTYTILFTDRTTTTFDVTDGEVTRAELEAVLPTDTASGSIASFPDGSDLFDYLSCVVNIDPVQDLHGYDKPWVGGAGKNLFDKDSITDNTWINDQGVAQPVTGFWLSDYIPISENTTYFRPDTGSGRNAYYASDKSFISYVLAANQAVTSPQNAAYIRIVGTGTTYTTAQFEKGSVATAYEPYSNICPITGWTGCEVDVRGFNLFDDDITEGYIDGTSGAYVPTSNHFCTANYQSCKPNTSYYFKAPSNALAFAFDFYDANKNFLSTSYKNINAVLTTPQNAYYFKFWNSKTNYGSITYNHDISINYPSTDTTYHAYNGAGYSVSWQTEAGTVYGGTVDLVTGVLTVTWASDTKQWNEYIAEHAPTGNIFKRRTFQISNNAVSGSDHSITNCIATYNVGTPTTIPFYYVFDNYFYAWLPVDTADDFSLQLVYELATPQTYQLDPVQVACLLGQNNVWADCGDVAVTYKADVQRWVEKKLGA